MVAGVLFVANPFALYLTGWYEATLRSGLLHDLNHLHFVLVGCLWFWPLLGLDPMPNRIPYPLRLLAVFTTMPLHAFLGVAIMGSSTLIAGDWYAEIDRSWGPAAGTRRSAEASCGRAATWSRSSYSGRCSCSGRGRPRARRCREDRRLDRLEAAERASAPPRASIAA